MNQNVIYAFAQESGHTIWRKWQYALTSGVSLWANFCTTQKDHVFITNVVGINLTWKTIASNVISRLISANVKLNAIANIHKCKGFHEGYHFIPMTMEVHGEPGHDMDHFIKECAHFFHDRWLGGHLSLSFCIQFFRQHVNITLQHVLTSIIKKKIALVGDVCFRPPITIRFHDLHASDIRGVVGEIASYHEWD
jgi:hypothetical protein